mmetsp:Transcript_31543/g.62542  ORF Transcript_31543/g.62542 Transcript_31543/m.62542 type:complete len:222 (-) Transcript_31543:694-1359(-)
MVETDPELEGVLERAVADRLANEIHVNVTLANQEEARVLVAGSVADQVQRRQPRLPPRCDENDNRFARRVLPDRGVARLVHGGHPRTVVPAGKALNMHLHRNRPHGRPEIVHPHATVWRLEADSHPFAEVNRVRQGRRKPHDPCPDKVVPLPALTLYQLTNIPGTAHYCLEHGTPLLSEQVNLVNHQEAYVSRELAAVLLPASRDEIPLLGGTNKDVRPRH